MGILPKPSFDTVKPVLLSLILSIQTPGNRSQHREKLRYHPGAEFKTGVQTVISHINYCGYVKIPARWLSRPLTGPKTSAKGCFLTASKAKSGPVLPWLPSWLMGIQQHPSKH
jgi:hypothetical protein